MEKVAWEPALLEARLGEAPGLHKPSRQSARQAGRQAASRKASQAASLARPGPPPLGRVQVVGQLGGLLRLGAPATARGGACGEGVAEVGGEARCAGGKVCAAMEGRRC